MRAKARTRKTDRGGSASKKAAVLMLEDGTCWRGFAFGAQTTQTGECVFHTALTGYQEVLTDPSYHKQILIFSSVELGNQGFHSSDYESERVWASGCVARDYTDPLFHWRKQKSLDQVLRDFNCPGVYGIDTRRLILHLREKGNLWGVLSTEILEKEELKKYLATQMKMEGLSLVTEVSTQSSYIWKEGSQFLEGIPLAPSSAGLRRCVVMDFGVKRQILRYLKDVGFEEVMVVPAKTSASEILKSKADAVLLSNGPGDPAADPEIIGEVKKLIQARIPILGICLGHQILALALGLRTYKLKFGHHGANHPVLNHLSQKVEITSHNHGFAVDSKLMDEIEWTHINLNDDCVEGFRHKKWPIRALQFHPESAPGPLDSHSIFSQFQRGFAA